jgi:glycosyltransferase involved in cell wall biosynthesis
MLQLLKLLKSYDFELHFTTTSQATEFSFDVKTLGIQDHQIELNSSSLDDLLKSLNPQIVIFDRFITEEQFGWKVDELCPKALKILDTEDLHFLREQRELKLKAKLVEGVLTEKAKRELAAMYRCDLNLIISKVEFDLLKESYAFPVKSMYYLPFLVETDSIKTTNSFSQRNHFVSIGNYKHKPNLDMVKYTSQFIWPSIRVKLPKAEWHIYGAYMPETIRNLNSPEKGIFIKGRAEKVVRTLQKYKVMLAFLRYGAGLKQKCIDAMLAGTPISTTAVGAEGFSEHRHFSGIVENRLESFASKTVQIYANEPFWKDKQAKGFSILKSSFSTQLHAEKFIDKIHYCINNQMEMRSKNLVGQLLKYHMFKSTKYMSLWIQEKNRKDEK